MKRLVVVASALAALALAGCSSDPDPTTPGTGAPDASATSPDDAPDGGDDSNGGTGGSGSGCAVISVGQVSQILGESYVEAPTHIEGAGPDGAFDQEGLTGYACLFSPADGDIHDLSITTFTDGGDLYNDMAIGDPVDGLGQRALLQVDEIEVTVVAERADHTVAFVTLTTFDGSAMRDKVIEITRIVLGAA